MGLDMYAFTVSAQAAKKNKVDLKLYDKHDNRVFHDERIAYWRKFNALHGWMEQLYRAKGGKKESFNCATVRLEEEDLDALTELAYSNGLKPVPGFFWGEQVVYPEDIESLKAFLKDAYDALHNGLAVYYDSWW